MDQHATSSAHPGGCRHPQLPDQGQVHMNMNWKKTFIIATPVIYRNQCQWFWFYSKSCDPHLLGYNHEIHDIETPSHDSLHLFLTQTSGAHFVLRHHIPELLQKFSYDVMRKACTHSIDTFVSQIKMYLIDSYSYVCWVPNCFVCKRWYADMRFVLLVIMSHYRMCQATCV